MSACKWLPAFRPPPAIDNMGLVEASSCYRVDAADVTPPACLTLVTDGVDEAALDRRPADAETLLRQFASLHDDATAVVIQR